MKVRIKKRAKCFTAYSCHGKELRFLGRSTDRDRESFRRIVHNEMLNGMVLIVGDRSTDDAHVGISALFQRRGVLWDELNALNKRRTYRRTPWGYLAWATHRHETVPLQRPGRGRRAY